MVNTLAEILERYTRHRRGPDCPDTRRRTAPPASLPSAATHACDHRLYNTVAGCGLNKPVRHRGAHNATPAARSASARSAAAASYVAAESASEPASRQTRAPPPRRVPRLAGPRKLWRKLPSRSSPPARSKSARASPQPGMKHRRRAPARGPGEWGRNGSSCAAPRPRPRLLSSCHRLPPQRVAEAQRFLICCPRRPRLIEK